MSEPGAESPELQAARRAREAQAARVASGHPPAPMPPPIADPVSFCVWTTVALLAWIFTPPATVAVFAAFGLWAYARAWRAGLRRSDCVLRDPRLVMLYLGLLLVAGAACTWLGWRAFALVHLFQR